MKQNAARHQQAKFNISQAVYGCRAGGLLEFGLAKAFNKEDYEVKLASFGWFKKKPSDFFVEGVIQSARECSDVCGLY